MAVYVIIFYFFYGVPAAYIIIITRASSSIISLLRHKSDEWTSRLQTSRVQRELWFLHIVVHLYQTTGNTQIQICTCTNRNTQTQLWFLYIVCLYNTSHSCSTQREPNYQNICPLPHWVSPPFRTRVWINKASTKIIASKFSVSQSQERKGRHRFFTRVKMLKMEFSVYSSIGLTWTMSDAAWWAVAEE